MGIHYPFGYVGYEASFLHTFIYLLDNYCSSCHTNEDVSNDCSLCPIGNLVIESKRYLLDAYESNILTEESKIIRKIKKEIKSIEPQPLFNANFIFQKKLNIDKLAKLRRLLSELEFVNNDRLIQFKLQEKIKNKIKKIFFPNHENKKIF